MCVCLISDLGEPACGIRVFRCRIQTKVHCSHSVGVSDHFTSALVVHAQTQQETHFLLLASCCGWRFTHLHSQYPTSYMGLVLKSIPYCTCSFCFCSSGCFQFRVCSSLLYCLEPDGFDYIYCHRHASWRGEKYSLSYNCNFSFPL